MTSNIDPTVPVTGTPTTASVRANFATAGNEITALQATVAGLLPLTGGSVTGALNVGTAQTNYWSLSGSSGSPLLGVTGTGNQFAQIQGNGVFGALLQSDNGNILRTQDDGGGAVTNYMQVIAGTGTNAIQLISTNNAAGMRFISPTQFEYNWAWSNATPAGSSNNPFVISSTVTGLANTGSTINLMPISITDELTTAQVLTVLPVIETINGGGGARTAFNSFIFANNVAVPAQWQSSFPYTVAGTVIQNNRNVYRLLTTGTSASSGGPTGTGNTINDNTCVWAYVINLEQYNYFNGGGFVNKCNVNLGGVALSGGDPGAGFVFGGGIVSALTNAAATNIAECTGLEIDCWAVSGSTVGEKGALKLLVGTTSEGGSANQGSYMDYCLMFNSQGRAYGTKTVMSIGSWSYASPLVSNSYIMQLQERTDVPPQFSGGIDLRFADVSGTGGLLGGGFLWASHAGAKIDGSGNFISGYGYMGWNTSGLVIDCTYQQATGATLVAAGTNFQVGAVLIDPVSGTRIGVDSIGTGGTIATFHICDNGWCATGSLPSNPVAFTTLPVGNGPGTLGSGATFNLSWTQETGLSLSPSGGATAIGGEVGFNGTAPIAKPTVTGSKGGNAALASLMTALANYGLVTDSTT